MTKKPDERFFEFVPEPMRALFGKRPLVVGESAAEYDSMLRATATAVNPQDAVECVYVKDFVDTTWEIQRYRRYHAGIIGNDIPEALLVLLQRSEQFEGRFGDQLWKKARNLAQAYCAGEPDALAAVAKLLASLGLTIESAESLAFSRKIDDLAKVAHMIAIAETRRRHIMREIDFHREVLGQRLRETVDLELTKARQLPNPDGDVPESEPLKKAS